MARVVSCLLLLMVVVVSALQAQVGRTPPAMELEGGAIVPLAAQAERVHLLGAVKLYIVAVYTDALPLNRERLVSEASAKALRIQVTYEDDLRRRIAIDWRRELVPPLEPAATMHLSGTFSSVRPGDVVSIEYAPAKGTFVRVNKAVVVSSAHHDLMLAFLDHWLGQRPVSDEMKRALLGSS